MRALRKLLSIALLVIFGSAFLSPLFALSGKSEANVPACCRRNGKHHCMMSAAESSKSASQKPLFSAPPEKCPYCPQTFAMVHGTPFAPSTAQAVYARLIAHPAVAAQTESKFRISRVRSRQKRGPPAATSL